MYRVLLIDSYDSYTYNLYQLILDVIQDAQIIVVRNDQLNESALAGILDSFDFIVLGPGPGNPCNASDIGAIREVFRHDVPILGVCLGFQLICLEYGGSVTRLGTAKHGQVSLLRTKECAIYGTESIQVTRYHSLTANITGCEHLQEVAWTDDVDNGHVSMSVIHKEKPFVGVQYHPESACSTEGQTLIRKFLRIVDQWNAQRLPRSQIETKGLSIQPRPLSQELPSSRKIDWRALNFVVQAPRTAELLGVESAERFVVLDSAASPSRYAVVAAIDALDKSFLYRVGQKHCTYGGERIEIQDSVWHVIAKLLQEHKVERGPPVPFWGGLIGYLSYESGVETLDVLPLEEPSKADDINLVMATRSIVIDHEAGTTHVISTRSDDGQWVDSVCKTLQHAISTPPASPPTHPVHNKVTVEMPDKSTYLRNIAKAQQNLAEGQSYELCLTAPTMIQCEVARQPWDLYQTLRRRNPSPFACYMKLEGVHMLSSSPERFLSWTADGHCQLRPIKGTVRKSAQMTREQATVLLKDPKEFAENLMIVDLIRHDLHQIAHNVQVPSLMVVEEYETVYQLVSVITGEVRSPYTGFDALAHALPPGSMTGAPKKRSVELLQGLEKRRRGLYSGVCGYLSICGGGDWSVIIRTAFRYDSENTNTGPETWWIGAGGAITALSDPESEWEEMLLKLQSTLPAF